MSALHEPLRFSCQHQLTGVLLHPAVQVELHTCSHGTDVQYATVASAALPLASLLDGTGELQGAIMQQPMAVDAGQTLETVSCRKT